jgi:hypothetical protein
MDTQTWLSMHPILQAEDLKKLKTLRYQTADSKFSLLMCMLWKMMQCSENSPL